MRVAAVHCPYWPVQAAWRSGITSTHLLIVDNDRVLTCSPAAHQDGAHLGMRPADALRHSPQAMLVPTDPGRDMRQFADALTVLADHVAQYSIIEPGTVVFTAAGPTRFHKPRGAGPEQAEAHLTQLLTTALAGIGITATAGIADGNFTAILAARQSLIVSAGQSAAWLAARPISLLDPPPQVATTLRRLGVTTVGHYAALPAAAVTRWGAWGMHAHSIAAGNDNRPLAPTPAPPDVIVHADFHDLPLDQTDRAAFAMRPLADELLRKLAARGLTCTQLGIIAVTATGHRLEQLWHHHGTLDADAIAWRLRIQLEAWLTRSTTGSPIVTLELEPHGLLRQGQLQPGLWGEPSALDDQADRIYARIQALEGPDSVHAAQIGDGNDPLTRVHWRTWGDPPSPNPQPAPWPAQLPAPHPAQTWPQPEPVELLDQEGQPVAVDARFILSAPPATLVHRQRNRQVTAWSRPMPLIENTGDPDRYRRIARLQILLADGTAALLTVHLGQWLLDSPYD